MKNKLYKKNIIFLGGFVVLVVLFLSINLLSQEHNQIVKTEIKDQEITSSVQKSEESSDLKMTDTDQNNQQSVNPDSENEVSEPKEIRIVAEEILYPDEYDFGDSMSEITLAAGKPIKFDASPLIQVQEGDLIEIELGGKNYNIELDSIKVDNHGPDETDSGLPTSTLRLYSSYDKSLLDKIFGSITYSKGLIIRGKLTLKSSNMTVHVYIHKDIAYYIDEYERQKEFYKRGYKLD